MNNPQSTLGKTKLTYSISSPANLSQEGKQILLSHADWMKSTHNHTGPKALLNYDVSEMDELTNPADLKSKPTGRTCFVLSETYESEAGVEDHFARAPEWKDWSRFNKWLDQCKVTVTPSGKIFNSLTWSGV